MHVSFDLYRRATGFGVLGPNKGPTDWWVARSGGWQSLQAGSLPVAIPGRREGARRRRTPAETDQEAASDLVLRRAGNVESRWGCVNDPPDISVQRPPGDGQPFGGTVRTLDTVGPLEQTQ